jgi:hypothetical protein
MRGQGRPLVAVVSFLLPVHDSLVALLAQHDLFL